MFSWDRLTLRRAGDHGDGDGDDDVIYVVVDDE